MASIFSLFGEVMIDNTNANKSIDTTTEKAEKSGSKVGSAFSSIAKGAATVHGEAVLHHPGNPQATSCGCHPRGPVPRVAGEPGRRAEERREGAHVCRLHQPQKGLPSRPIAAAAHRPDCQLHRRV